MIAGVIVACEIAFWVLLLGGLVARYPLRRPRLGAALLVASPLVDAVLLTVVVIDLRGGAEATTWHALAGVYLGVSIVFGHRTIRWADTRFAHRFAGGPPPARGPRYGAAHAARERAGWYRHALAWLIGSATLGVCVLVVGDTDRTEALIAMPLQWGVVLVIDFAWSFSYTLRPRRAPDAA